MKRYILLIDGKPANWSERSEQICYAEKGYPVEHYSYGQNILGLQLISNGEL